MGTRRVFGYGYGYGYGYRGRSIDTARERLTVVETSSGYPPAPPQLPASVAPRQVEDVPEHSGLALSALAIGVRLSYIV